MYKERFHFKAKDGESWMKLLQLMEEVNKISTDKGLIQASFWTQSYGTFNEIVVEAEYPDLATLEKETQAFMGDPEIMSRLMQAGELTREPGHSELWQTAEVPPGIAG